MKKINQLRINIKNLYVEFDTIVDDNLKNMNYQDNEIKFLQNQIKKNFIKMNKYIEYLEFKMDEIENKKIKVFKQK